MDAWKLPKSLNVGGVDYRIRTDFRDILLILFAFNDPELTQEDIALTMLDILYKDIEVLEGAGSIYVKYKDKMLSQSEVGEAMQKAVEFIDAGVEPDGRPKPRTMDWEQDAAIIFPSINKCAGRDVRSLKYMHWWTFLGFFMEIPDGTFMQVLNIRQKKQRNEKLEKWESKFYRDNKKLCDLQNKYTDEEKEKLEALNKMLG